MGPPYQDQGRILEGQLEIDISPGFSKLTGVSISYGGQSEVFHWKPIQGGRAARVHCELGVKIRAGDSRKREGEISDFWRMTADKVIEDGHL